ncbi:MAG: hypothetical protein Q8O79_07760 [Pseudomonadota bacterium]|nr:hypothetical protein [Pseudomonadota bacterium]
MSASKINELFDTLRVACARQFGFNPRRITAGMRYVGKEGHGKDLVHIFRDAGTHSQMVLKSTLVTLREKQGNKEGDKPHWTEAEKARYKSTDAEIDAEIEAKQAELDFTRNCSLYQDHREQLLSHYTDWPGFQPDGPHPGEAARALIVALADAHDPRLAEFAEHMHSNDPEHLAHLLLAPCHLEVEAGRAAASMDART